MRLIPGLAMKLVLSKRTLLYGNDWLFGWLVGRSVGLFVCWLVGWLVGWSGV
jgi:hypothetical protein